MSDGTSEEQRRRYSCVTDYERLYAREYFAHDSQSASFDLERVPQAVVEWARQCGSALLDIGGGNGLLARLVGEQGIRTFTVDAKDAPGENFRTLDLSRYEAVAAGQLRNQIGTVLGPNWFVTCLDVAEHIDREDMADFLLTLRDLVVGEGMISISTRPSSSGNRFHASVLPISTWHRLLDFAGFEIVDENLFPAVNAGHLFSGDTEGIGAVAHWQRVNPFRDIGAHQHYIRIRRRFFHQTPQHIRRSVAQLLDIEYLDTKRGAVTALPKTIFSVNFIQDWSFVRLLMDIYRSGDLQILLRHDCIAPQYLHLIRNYCERTATPYSVIGTAAEGAEAMASWQCGTDKLFITATEGLPSPTHAMNSLLAWEAAKLGAKTLSMQHGVNILKGFSSSCDVIGAWDTGTAATLSDAFRDPDAPVVRANGSLKFLDCLMPAGSDGLSARLGKWAERFTAVYLIGLNLHWQVHQHEESATYLWIRRLLDRNPNCLFLLRPHPDDHSVYSQRDMLTSPNFTLIDDMTLLAMDRGISRLIKDVDGVIATSSTLLLDALAAGKPTVMLPALPDLGGQAVHLFGASWPTIGGIAPPVMSEQEWLTGMLPTALTTKVAIDPDWFGPSMRVLSNIADVMCLPKRSLHAIWNAAATNLVAGSVHMSFDHHPHRDMIRMSEALRSFVAN